LTRVELKTLTFSQRAQSLSIDNAVLGSIPKRIAFTMLKNTDFLGSFDSNPYNFRHYNLNYFSLFVNGKQYPNEGLSMDIGHEKTSVLAYNTLFEGSGIHHSNAGLQITHDMYIASLLLYHYGIFHTLRLSSTNIHVHSYLFTAVLRVYVI
jgi:hypothetical protein